MVKPDLIIGPPDRPYMYRWHLIRFRGWQLCLHKICRSDDERALHDHKADNFSLILWGEYTEVTEGGRAVYGPLSTIYRPAEKLHRLLLEKPVWSLWWRGKARREWGFVVPGRGWMHNLDYFTEFGEYAT